MYKNAALVKAYRNGISIGMLLLLAACGLALAGSEPSPAESGTSPSAVDAVFELDGTTVSFTGQITDQNVERFLETVSGREVSVLVIASGGGDVNAGMAMGDWLFDHRVDVVVDRMCMSSCANYVFTAGRRKTINAGAIVAWHGNLLQQFDEPEAQVRAAMTEYYNRLPEESRGKVDLTLLIEQNVRQMKTYMDQSKERQAHFFEKIGVDEYICRIGNELYGAEDFFALSIQDMARFGVHDVQAPENYTATDLTPFRRTGKSVEFIALN